MKIQMIATCMALMTSCVISYAAQQPIPGGSTTVPVTKKEVVDAASFAIKAEEKTLNIPKEGRNTKLELVKILNAKEQVVAGMNYHLKLKVKLNGKVKNADVTVWWQAWRKPDPYQLISWKWNEQPTEPDGGANGG